MNAPSKPGDPCRNPGCVRLADPGDTYCFACGLERSLYDRDSRRAPVKVSAPREDAEPRR
jgi:hypothetical protein